jgi:hypothetical protein
LGMRIDCTLEPGCEGHSLAPGELSVGNVPDRRTIPTAPYRPAASDFLQPCARDRLGLVLFPMSTAIVPPPRGWRHILRRLARRKIGKMHLGHHPEHFRPMFEEVIARPTPHVVIAARSDFAGDPSQLRFAEENLDWMLRHRLAERFVFTSPTSALALMDV